MTRLSLVALLRDIALAVIWIGYVFLRIFGHFARKKTFLKRAFAERSC
jgi:hypothetical protein